MTTVTFQYTVPNGQAVTILNKITTNLGYTDMVQDENGTSYPNPLTRKQFLNKAVYNFLKDHYDTQVGIESAAVGVTARNVSQAASTPADMTIVDV
jgi:hypothetical protein